jgi:tetratricopeptide (TPR) repeat protein
MMPDSAEARHYRGTELQRQRKIAEAIPSYEEAVQLAPENPLYRIDLAFALDEKGDTFAASGQFRESLNLAPSWPAENNRIAWILATHPDPRRRDGAEAIRRAKEACIVTQFKYPPFLETLAAAYAEAGSFKPAIDTADRAHALALEAGDTKLAERLTKALHRYKKGQPIRDGERK